MLTPETIDATARVFLEMHRSRARYHPLDPALRAAPLDDAYRIQDALHGLMADAGWGEIAGWKIALTSKAMQQMTGVDQPAAGAIFSTVVHPSPARIELTAYHHLGVEFEVAVRLADGGSPGCQAGARRAGRMSPARIPRRGSRGNNVCPSYTLSPRDDERQSRSTFVSAGRRASARDDDT